MPGGEESLRKGTYGALSTETPPQRQTEPRPRPTSPTSKRITASGQSHSTMRCPPSHCARVGDHTRARDEVQQSVGQAALLLSFVLKGTDDGRERERRESLWRKPTHAQYPGH